MSDRGKIITIYVVVAILSVAVLGTSFWLRESRKRRFTPIADKVGGDVAEDFGRLEKDLVLTNQEGEEVKLSALRYRSQLIRSPINWSNSGITPG